MKISELAELLKGKEDISFDDIKAVFPDSDGNSTKVEKPSDGNSTKVEKPSDGNSTKVEKPSDDNSDDKYMELLRKFEELTDKLSSKNKSDDEVNDEKLYI